jgi:hypothetical protein
MSEGILGNATGGFGFPKTYVITDGDGNELTATYVESETIFTATDNDVRTGMVYAGDNGVSTGTKDIPAYHTWEGRRIIPNGSSFIIPTSDYTYTRLQAIICTFNTSIDDSVSSEKVVINDGVYNIQSTSMISEVIQDEINSRIDFGLVNDTGKICVVHYFMYKEIY